MFFKNRLIFLLVECGVGLLWAMLALLALFVHLYVNVDVSEFRYVLY